MDKKIFKTEQQQLAYLLSKQLHKDQKYGIHSYFDYHILGVVRFVQELGYGDDYITVALLHDVLEDTDITEDILHTLFNYEVVEAVGYLTKIKGSNYNEKTYLKQIKQSHLATIVKVADSTFNMYENIRNKHKERIKKYTSYLAMLTS